MHKRIKYSLEYIAGFFDGEGSVGIYGNGQKSGHSLRVQVTQNYTLESKELMSHLHVVYGGYLGESFNRKGNLNLHWQLSGEKTAKFLEDILPFLHIKNTQVAFALQWNTMKPKKERGKAGKYLPFSLDAIEENTKASDYLKYLKTCSFIKT